MPSIYQKSPKPLNTPKKKQAFLDRQWMKAMRDWLAAEQCEKAERLRATRELFGEPVTIFDPHTHSDYSDGRATIAQNRDAGLRAGIDVVFAADHNSLTQKRSVKGVPSMSWGQEPQAGNHHIGLLHNSRRLYPRKDGTEKDFDRARKLAPFTWIPHPAGWFTKDYSEERKNDLWKLGPAFAMEVINGAKRIHRAFERHDAEAVELWDRLLTDSIRVTPLAGSDAHLPEAIGNCWTAIPKEDATAESIIAYLNNGRCLASESPLLTMEVKGQPMGNSIDAAENQKLRVKYRVADAAGLQSLGFVADGISLQKIYTHDQPLVEDEWEFTYAGQNYIRLEVRACDDLRAFSAPVYFD